MGRWCCTKTLTAFHLLPHLCLSPPSSFCSLHYTANNSYAGKIRDVARDYKARCALVEFER